MRHALILALALALAIAGFSTPGAAAPLRDPFMRPPLTRPAAPAETETPATRPRLRALVLNGAHSLANIDGNVVAAGERCAGYTVLRIDARGVLLVRPGKELLLTMQDKDTP